MCQIVLAVEDVVCVGMEVGIGLSPCFPTGRGMVPCKGGVAFANTVGIVVRVTANVGEGVGVVGTGVGVCLPGGVLVGFTADGGTESTCRAFACACVIPATVPMQEKKRSKSAHVAIRARATVDVATLERAAVLMT